MHDAKLVARENDNFCSKRLIINPDHKLLLFWNPIVIVALIFTAFATPYKIAFVKTDSFFDKASNSVIDCIFLVDLFVNFLLAYEDPKTNKLVRNPSKIAIKYLKSWFFMDFVACVPLDNVLELMKDDENLNITE